MLLESLISIMNKKKYYYFDGTTNTKDNDLYIDFSTLHNGKGNWMEFRIGVNNHDINYRIEDNVYSYKNLSDSELLKKIKGY